nr:MAG TPA: hypothetical protein [Caudoviricetes sp.]
MFDLHFTPKTYNYVTHSLNITRSLSVHRIHCFIWQLSTPLRLPTILL